LYSELVLASTSAARRALLTPLGLPFRAETPGVEETVPKGTATRAAVAMLAERKARAVLSRWPTALIIGADQLVDLDGVALGKPKNDKAARAQLERLSGRAHDIITAVCVIGPAFFACDIDVAHLSIEGRGQALFSAIDGDRTSVQGLPMLLLTRLLREAGVQFFH
jgi:septum formation protein